MNRLRSKTKRDPRIAVPMKDALKEYLRETGLGPRLRHHQIYKAYAQALGRMLSKRARPVRFQGGRLTVEVESAAHLHELANFSGEGIRQRANQILGTEQIARVDFKLKS